MLKVEDYARIRLAHRDGMSIRAIARKFGHSRHTIRKLLNEATPKPYTLTAPRAKRKLIDSFQQLIDEILESDLTAPRKQRHTAKRIYTRLRDEHGFVGGYDSVRRYVKSQRTETRETFLPISSAAGQRAESDFGQIEVDFPDGRRSVSVLLITWSHSNAVFAIALASEKVEAILRGTVEAFAFFDCVPKELWWDNPKTVAKSILRGRQRELNPYYQSLASHYNFEPLFCQPARGNEKPHVEGRVKWMKQNWATPVPCVKDLDELNAYLRRCCEQDQSRMVSGKQGTIVQRFQEEKQGALRLPTLTFDASVSESRDVDKYQTVAWEGNRYSVPRRDAFSKVVVKAYVDRIEVFRDSRRIASHLRSYEKHQMILDPLHYLTLLERKPAYLDHTEVYKTWQLPQEFAELRQQFELRHGSISGARQFIQVLQLLAKHSQLRVLEAVQGCRREGIVTAQRVVFRCEELANQVHDDSAATRAPTVSHTLTHIEVPLPDLARFDALLSSHEQVAEHVSAPSDQHTTSQLASNNTRSISTREDKKSLTDTPSSGTQGGVTNDQQEPQSRSRAFVAQVQPEATSLADDVVGTREVSARSSQCEPGLPGISSTFDGTGVGHSSLEYTTDTNSFGQFSNSEGTRFL